MTPSTETVSKRVEKQVFDLDAKGEITLVKVGQMTPLTSIEEFVAKLNNDAELILKYANAAYAEFYGDQLASDPIVEWQVSTIEEDEETGPVETLAPYTGREMDPEKVDGFRKSVINIASNLYGYAKTMIPNDVEANRKAKAGAKQKATEFILENPAAKDLLAKK